MGIRFCRKILSIAFFLVLFLVPALVSAQVEKYTDVTDGADFFTDSTVNAFDDKVDSSIWSTIDTVYYAKGMLVFEINPDIPFYLPDTFFCDLTLTVKTYDSTNTLINSATRDMILHYDTVKNRPYANRAVIYFDNAYRIEASYTHIDYRQGNGNLIPPEIFRLSAQINVLRTYNFDCDVAPDINTASYDAVHDRIEVSWAPFSGATGYDFEWTFFDDSSEVVKKMNLGYLNFDSLFRFNSTRITLDGTSATISAMYTSGYLFYRVRAIKVLPGFQNVFSEWTSDDDDKFAVDWHEGTLTWQSSISFAEEGKRKEVISYFDGSLRNRQTVTRINQVDTAVVSETIYDFQGRPAVKVLPAPTFDPQIKYYPQFNVDMNGDYYSWANFDTASCGNTPDYMDSISGASKYYSPTNPMYDQAPYKYIPDAKGYPFSITEYTGDNTGRISRQSGVGPYLMFNDSVHRETRYFYGKPSQFELDRLFGNDVGDSSHYTEEMVIDPNGQISITYKDAHDRVIATALAGTPPPNLIQLPEYMPEDTLRTFLKDNNRIEDKSWISSTSFLAKNHGNFTFYYNLFPDFLRIANCDSDSICYDCYYDISISVASTCSPSPYSLEPLVSRSYKNYQLPRNDSVFYDTLCFSPDTNLLDSFIVTLDPGSYFITRKITVSDSAITFYTEKFIRENACNTFETFYQNELAALDSSGCVTCETCLDQLGDTTEFFTSYFSEWDTIVPTSEDTAQAVEIYSEAYQTCMLMCSPFDDCGMRQDLMMSDFTPGAQYARYETDNGPPVSYDVSSILYWDGANCRFQNPGDGILPYLDESGNEIKVMIDGTLKSIEELTPEQFVNYYDVSWAYGLLKLHPEYCYLKFCEANSGAHEYFAALLQTNSYDEAYAAGFTDPLASTNPDPFFQTESGVPDSSLMRVRMEQFKYVDYDSYYTSTLNPDTSCHNRVMSMWDIAILTAIKGILPAGFSNCDTIDISTLCTGDKNIAWMVFRALYIQVRDSIYHKKEWKFVTEDCERATAVGNCCIGSSLSQYQQLGHSCVSGGEYCNSSYFEKTPRFFYLPPSSPLNWQNETQAAAWATQDKVDSTCASICHGHRNYWKQKLNEYCGNIDTLSMHTLLDMFQEICEHGCDINHALGSSTVPPGDPLFPGTFQDAMEYVLGISPINPTCNAVLIDMPRPYENPGKLTTSEIAFPKPSECTCEKFDSLFTQMIIDTAGTTLDSFAVYLTVNYGSMLTVDQLYQIKLHCHDTLCKNMTEPIIIPPVLSCGACLPCDSVNSAFTDFKDYYADVLASPEINALLGGYLNNRFGFHLKPEDYIQFIVDCNIDTSGVPNLITCDSIKTLFSDYISSSPTQSLDEWFNSVLYLNYSYSDYSMWIFSCAFDTITTGFIPCDTLVKYINEFYTSGLPADSFVTWMNDTLFINYSYLQYAAWIANCDSTDLIPYANGMAMRHTHSGTNSSFGSSVIPQKANGTSQFKGSKRILKRSKEQIKAEFENVLKNRNGKLKASTNPPSSSGGITPIQSNGSKSKIYSPAKSSSSTHLNTNSTSSGRVTSFSPEKFINSIGAKNAILDYLKVPARALNVNTLLASADNEMALDIVNDMGALSMQNNTLMMMPGSCSDLNDALIAYNTLPAGFHPPLTVWLNFTLDENYSYADYALLISSCGLIMPSYSAECDSINVHLTSCISNEDLCMVASCLNLPSGLDFTIHEYFQWFDSCSISFVDCGELNNALDIYINLDPAYSPPLTIFLQSYFNIRLTYEEWVSLIDDCSLSVPPSTFECENLGDIYDECFLGDPQNVIDCLNGHYGIDFLWSEYKQWLDSCQIPYIDCELISSEIEFYIEQGYTIPLRIWLNHQLGLNLTSDQYAEYMALCGIEAPGDNTDCIAFKLLFDDCSSQGTLLQLDSCLNVSLGIDFTLSEYLQWLDECNLDFIPCDSLLEILNAYNAINVGIRPPLAVFLYDTLGINLTVEEFMVLFTNCSYDPVDFEDCDSLELFFDLCGSSVAPHLIDSCLNTFTNLDLTLTSYLSWLDSCQIPHDSISCGLLSMAVSQYPCWQDTISLTGWINYYLELNQQDIYYILYMDSCGIVPPCCGQLSNALDSFPCFTTSMSTYDWLDSTMQVNLPDSFWISTMDSCGISFSCDTCTWLSSQVYGYPCQDTLTLTQWLNIYSGLTMSDSAWFALIDTCGIDYPCSISCTEIQMILVDYPCDSSLTIAQWLNSQTSFQYSDSTWMVMLDTCDIMIPCIPDCDSLSNIIPQFPCDFSTSLTDWLNEQFGLSLSEQEYLFALDSCGITFQCDSCNYLDSLIGTYTCNDSLSLTEWLNDHTGWSLNDTAYMALLDSCNITWDTLCVPPCDSLQLLQGSYPCNSGIPITTWLNDILNLAFTDYEWGQIFIDCPVDTMHCICPPLDSLVLLYPCNDSLALVDWLNIQTGWNLSDSVYLFYLDSCKIAWDTVCTNCDTLQLLQSSYPCNSTLTVGEWFNQQLNLSYTDLEWDFILSECRINLACDSCSLLDSLIGSFPCNDTLTLSEWLNQQIGWSKTDSQYVSMLDSCDLYDAWQAQCDSCVADFTFTIDSLNCHRVHFVNQSNSSIALTSYHWNFGASTFGDNDSVPDPTELYFTNDTFTVCLTITHRDSSGNILCTDSVCKDVIIISTPLVTISVDSATFCKGQTQVLVANAGASVISYLWNPGGSTNDSLIVSSAGTYIVQVSNGTCFASDTQVISLYDTLSPNITIIGSANLCTGSTTSDLQADLDSYNTPASSWLWSTTETTNLITVYTQGTYCVTALDVHGCYVHACQEITETALPDPPVIDPSSTFTICTDGFIFEGDSIHCLNYSNNLLWSTSETTQSIYVDYEDNFYVIYTDSNGCFSTSSSVSVILNYFSLPPDSISSNHAGNTTCGGVAVMLTEYGGLLSSGVNQPNDQGYWAWYADSCGGTLIDTGASVTVYPTATTTYYVRAEGSCGSSCDSITITVQSCDPCLVLDSLLNEYPCNDTLSLVDWLNQQTNWNLTDSAWLAVIDSCSLDSSWIPNCIPSCDSIQLIEHSFPCDSNITLYAWLNDTLNVSYSETEWDSIFVWCPPDTLCGLDSCEILTAFYNEWDSAGTYGPLETWFNYQLQMNYSYWDYLQMLDDCGTYIQIPCDSIDSLLAIYNLIPEPKIIFRVWLTFQVGLHYPDIDFNLSLDSCNIIPPPINCDTFRLYVDYFEAYHPAQNIIEWLNNVLGENYLLSDYLQWFDTCGPTPSLCDYYDSLYTYYTSNADTVPLEQWFNDQTGLNYTYWQYVYLLQDCFPVSIPCDTLLYVWNAANNLPVPIPFYLYANNYWGLNYTPDWYCYLLDSCGIYSGPCDTSSCDSLQMLYSTYNAIIPQPDLTTWMNDTLGLNFSYWEYVQWFDTCIYLPLPCDTISNLYIYHRDNNISIPFADWMNNHLNLNYSLAYYQHLLDSCNIVDRCDSLDMAITAFLTQPDTSLDFTTFMNTYLGWSLTLEQYQSELADCHQDTAIWLCDGGIVQPSADSILTEDCMDDFIQMAFSNAQHNYDLYLDSLKGAFVDQYTSHCLNSFNEDFYVDGPFSEYHYTLYYYDQAGNLAQTIPPNGVVPFSDSDTLEDIAEFRSNPYGSSLPIYRVSPYATHYNYNTLNKPVGQHTPDADSAHFWYDRLGRLIFSRNAQQRIDAVMSMSYTVYDDLGRIAEVGKMDTLPFLGITDDWARDTLMVNYYLENSHHTEITHTYYDAPAFSPSSGFEQENLRNRVASITWENNNDHDSLTFDFATHYTYDITGNVRTILQETPQLAVIGQNLKRIDYDYDLVSGKVNYVYYQKDSIDQFIHHYEYDDDNRITHVYTSRDNMLWDEDAHYDYYLHGPLARVELGQHKVQGVDYAYTLQGWMKGINSSTLYPDRDMGRDGKDLSNGFSCDAYGFSLGYFYHDYKQIDPDTNWQADYTAGGAGSTFGTDAFGSATNLGLYNGNIRHTVLSMDSMNYPNIGYVYQYDQLNRLKEMNAYANLDTINNEWDNTAALADYKELIDFDPNGNILNYLRRGTTTGTHTLGMDSLSYSYNSGNNKLDHVSDNSAYNSNYTEDIDAGQSSGNYDYDANGNLIADAAEGLNMTWWNNGKLKSVAKAAGDTLTFYYDVSGNRVMKKYFNNTSGDTVTTVYVRDAQGNIMATYEWKNADSLRLQELDIYGSSRLGMLREDSLLACLGCSTITNTGSATLFTGSKLYELTNHLGNVLSTITDKKVYVDADANDTADYSVPEIASQQDYYPFGMLMPGRRISLSDYRFGFNKQEKVDEISGLGNHNTAMFWEYDPRRGIRWNKDPLTYPWQSPYSCYNNNPIIFVDPLGLFASRKEAREYKNENNLSGRVRKNDDGIYSIDDKKVGSSIFKDAEFGITKGALVQGTRVDNKHLSPLQLGVEWASGNGARSRAFTEGDDITTKYKQHEFVNETRKKIKEQLQNINGEIKLPIEGNNPYSLRGIEGVEKYLKDYSTLGTGGLIGNLVYTYLGSHSLQYTITDIDVKNRNAIVTFFVFNTSTMQSATRPPLIGYQEWYQNSIGKIIDNQFQSGPFSETEQSIEWIENIKY